MTKPILSILFLSWNALDKTEKSLQSILMNTFVPYELILIDNGSTEDNVDMYKNVEEKFHKGEFEHLVDVKLVLNKDNLGVSKGYNRGLPQVNPETEYITISSNDWIFPPHWAERMIDCLESEPMCGLATACSNMSATSMIDSPENPHPIKKPVIEWDDPELFDKVKNIDIKIQASNNKIYRPNNFVCIGWTMKKEVYDKVGLMDEDILSANDVSYTYLAVKHGYISKTCWDVYIHHFWRASGNAIGDQELARRDRVDWQRILTHEDYVSK